MKDRLLFTYYYFIVNILVYVKSNDYLVDVRDIVFETIELKSAQHVKYVGRNYIHTAMIMTNVLGKPKKEKDINVDFQMYGNKTKLLDQFERMIQSLLEESTGTSLHFIYITDEESMPVITKVIKDKLGQYLSEAVIKIPHVNHKYSIGKVPKMKVEFVDIESITSKHREEIDLMKTYFGHHLPPGTVFKNPETGQVIVPTFKYTLDLFYILPFYHQEFPQQLEKLIVLDIDLEFRFTK